MKRETAVREKKQQQKWPKGHNEIITDMIEIIEIYQSGKSHKAISNPVDHSESFYLQLENSGEPSQEWLLYQSSSKSASAARPDGHLKNFQPPLVLLDGLLGWCSDESDGSKVEQSNSQTRSQ